MNPQDTPSQFEGYLKELFPPADGLYGELRDARIKQAVRAHTAALEQARKEAAIEELEMLLKWYLEAKVQPYVGSMVDEIKQRAATLKGERHE